ncbi:PREDICTED: cation channel sperm-associated protein 1-like isoform X2 [Amphimedon queenslandica]|uniref:Ion transport domain-containing protein n=2 Tax=Amphimedon queenslandica TaxID=400682 RepID=A0AAN0J157_AMPQE|nr:PREDICTED: cation channel sperm-associated protein 1-like isoform X2 [Amphimedon queenslandica]|eukprot:XP_019850769.1 PREDICTED: cation channel sperm-associated protein 1-like isoform X2 [Amphimedon queenslandica]
MLSKEKMQKFAPKKWLEILTDKLRKAAKICLPKEKVFHVYANEVVTYRSWFDYVILFVVVLHFLFICLNTYPSIVARTIECSLRIYALRLDFFKSPWNVFEALLFLNMAIDFILMISIGKTPVSIVFSVIGAFLPLRILRLLRKLNWLESLKVIMSNVALKSVAALSSIILLTSLILFIFAVIGRGLYSEVDPDRFGNLAKASITLFQLLTLDEWYYMYADVINNYPNYQHILLYLMLFIILETFIFFNLFIAVIVDNLAGATEITRRNKASHAQGKIDVAPDIFSGGMLQDEDMKRQTVDDYYPQLSNKDKLLHKRYWQLIASLEHQLHTTHSHQKTLNELVDLVDFSKN